MKNDVLSNDEVAALVEAARQGNVTPADEAPAPRRRAKRVRDIDFSRPNKFAADQLRRLERAHEACCRTIGSRPRPERALDRPVGRAVR